MKQNLLKAKLKIRCGTCDHALIRTKSFRVLAENEELAAQEARDGIERWKKSLVGTDCKVCATIKRDFLGDHT